MNTGVLIILLFVVIAVAVSQLGVILYFVNFIKKNQIPDGTIKDAQEKSASVIAEAVAKSNELVVKAQEEQIEKVSEESKKLDELAKQFEQTVNDLEAKTNSELTGTAKEATESLETVAQTSQESLQDVVQTSQKTLETMASESQETLKTLVATDRKVLEEKTDTMINQSSQVFQQFMTQLSTQVREQLAGELDTAKKEIDIYKKERINTINEKIIDILEETLVATLGKKLSLKDEGEFVFQALETAKKEHVFG